MSKQLRYPLELDTAQVDYVMFLHEEYRTNRSGESGQTMGSPVILYMPTTTPAVSQTANWGDKSFAGPLGELQLDAISMGIDQLDKVDITSFEKGRETGRSVADAATTFFSENVGKTGAAARQGAVGFVASKMGMTPNQLLVAAGKTEVYNPNVELLYDGPKLRGFNFNFTFVPKSPLEATRVNEIIMEFKKWSAPGDTGNGMFKIPHVWRVSYESNGKPNPFMNKFKKAALQGVSVQNNQGMNMHMSFDDGMPVITTIGLNFTEVDIITREDHEKAGNFVGY